MNYVFIALAIMLSNHAKVFICYSLHILNIISFNVSMVINK